MNSGAFLVILIDFILIGLLPVIFFKRGGKLNLMWWMTATPFLVSVGSVIVSQNGWLPPVTGYGMPSTRALELLAVPLNVASIGLICFTLGTHRIPIALWHQTNDAPKHIVTWGAYQHIRHPFYASFLLAFLGALCFSPQFFTLAGLIMGTIVLNATAEREEKRLSTSEFGEEYVAYIQRTGRFFPRLGGSANG